MLIYIQTAYMLVYIPTAYMLAQIAHIGFPTQNRKVLSFVVSWGKVGKRNMALVEYYSLTC